MTITLQKWFILYSENHQNPLNKKIHYACVPLIFFSLAGITSLIEIPVDAGENLHFHLGLHYLMLACALIFYLRHSLCIFYGIFVFTLLCIMLIEVIKIQHAFAPLQFYTSVFALAWTGQFIGHKIEGKKPSFFTDVVFLLIGPAWIIKNIFLKLEFEY
jgi:uncharacterized membrane protein YGL010W